MIMRPIQNILPSYAVCDDDLVDWRPDSNANFLQESPYAVGPLPNMDPQKRTLIRHRTVMRVARLSSDLRRTEALGIVRNISESGMRIDVRCCFDVGENIHVSMLDGDRVKGKIVWKDGTSAGIKILSSIPLAQLLAKPRVLADGTRARPPRIRLKHRAKIRIGENIIDAGICDISQKGAKVRLDKSVAVEGHVQISLYNLRPVSASVKWQIERLIGLEFHRILSINELSSWIPDISEGDSADT